MEKLRGVGHLLMDGVLEWLCKDVLINHEPSDNHEDPESNPADRRKKIAAII